MTIPQVKQNKIENTEIKTIGLIINSYKEQIVQIGRQVITLLREQHVNVLAMGAFYVAPAMGCDIADAYLNAELGSGYEWWYNFYEFHKLAIDELEAFNYEEYKKNGFKMEHIADYPLKLETKPE